MQKGFNDIYTGENIGTIYTSPAENSPNTDHYLFIVDPNVQNSLIRQGMFCSTLSEEGMLIGKIEDIIVNNEYYSNPQTVKNFDKGYLSNICSYFPSEKWEDYLAYVKVLGVFPKIAKSTATLTDAPLKFQSVLKRSYFPAKPGSKVSVVQGELLDILLGIDPHGLYIGSLSHYNTPVKLNLSRLINKHVAILAMSGAGKSYLVSVVLEELLKRSNTNQGTPGIILFDVHGEYKFFTDHNTLENQEFTKFTTRHDARYFQIAVSSLTAYDFAKFQPNISNAQIRELKSVLNRLKYEENNDQYDISEIITRIEKDQSINQKVRSALSGWLSDLNRNKIFAKKNHPVLRTLIEPGRLNIIDLSSLISIRKKQIIVSFLLDRLFYMRRKEEVPPFFIILEEAHQFAPEHSINNSSISKSIIETIAREGRKFFGQLCLISQRPVKLSNTVLSQCNTHIILRVTNPNDLDHIKATSEALTRESMRMISNLPTGNALLLGNATNFPIFVNIRNRICKNTTDIETLEDVCSRYTKL